MGTPTFVIPNRVSDAGPDAQSAPDWIDFVYDAKDELSRVIRLECLDTTKELQRRQEAIDRAISLLTDARAALPKPRTAADLARGEI